MRKRYDFAQALADVAEEAAQQLEAQGDRQAARRLRQEAEAWNITDADLEDERQAAQDKGLLRRLLGL